MNQPTYWLKSQAYLRTFVRSSSAKSGDSRFHDDPREARREKSVPALDRKNRLPRDMAPFLRDYLNSFKKHGNSEWFSYATNKDSSRSNLSTNSLPIWEKLTQDELAKSGSNLPKNGFEDLIQLTEQGRLWKFPIDNEQGMEAEQSVPFEDHVFLEDQYLDEFPKNPKIRSVMSFTLAGLSRNNWMTVERKREVIKFFKEYFEEKKEFYRDGGFDIDHDESEKTVTQ